MKHIIINMSEITESREVYDSRPHPFFSMFIYLIMLFLTITVIWACFGEIEEYVQTSGLVRPAGNVSVVMNAVAGFIDQIHIYEGMEVSAGDVLYTIDASHIRLTTAEAERNLERLRREKELLTKFVMSVRNERNLFNESNENESGYYYRYQRYLSDRSIKMAVMGVLDDNALMADIIGDNIRYDMLVQIEKELQVNSVDIERVENELLVAELILAEYTIKAPIDGTINMYTWFNQGDFIPESTDIARIVPSSGGEFRVLMGIPSGEIYHIYIGQSITFGGIGELTGYITNISTDARIDSETGRSYYLVEAVLINSTYTCIHGEEYHIVLPGTTGEVRIITRTITILQWFLERVG